MISKLITLKFRWLNFINFFIAISFERFREFEYEWLHKGEEAIRTNFYSYHNFSAANTHDILCQRSLDDEDAKLLIIYSSLQHKSINDTKSI